MLSGVCFVGLWDPESLLYFVAVPLSACLVTGAVFLVIGITSHIKIGNIVKKAGRMSDKDSIDRLVARIGKCRLGYFIDFLVRRKRFFFNSRRIFCSLSAPLCGRGGHPVLRVLPLARVDPALAGGNLQRPVLQ